MPSGPAALRYAVEALKQVTILFMNVVGSTRIRERVDPEDTRTLIRSASPMRCPGTILSSQYAHFQIGRAHV